MKYLIITLFVGTFLFVGTSCEKCTTCTFNDSGTVLEEEFCGNGESHDDQERAYERNGWSCSKS